MKEKEKERGEERKKMKYIKNEGGEGVERRNEKR